MKKYLPLFAIALLSACAHREPPPAATPQPAAAAAITEAGFVCTQIMGVSVTGDWFNAGFEQGLDDGRWQAITRTKAFVNLWGDPANDVWKVPVVSPCTARSNDPDRVVLMAVSWELTTADQWTAAIGTAVETIRSKYPGLKRLELLTMLRGPGNQTCGNAKTVVQPYIDEAVARVAAAHPELVRIGPKLEVASCDVFTKGGPHFTEAGFATVAGIYRAHYLAERSSREP